MADCKLRDIRMYTEQVKRWIRKTPVLWDLSDKQRPQR